MLKKLEDIDVSIIVCTYNPDIDKLKRTLFSAIMQKKINFEIIVADDGSSSFDEDLIRDYFVKNNFKQYHICKSSSNQGTVKNIYNGLLSSKGKYVYIISPGDYFYESSTLSELCEFSEENECAVCFGEAACYEESNGDFVFSKPFSPRNPYVYSVRFYNQFVALTGFFSGQYPVGATYFRRREIALYYMGLLQDKVKYLEDYPSTALLLLDKKEMKFFPKPVVWYEYGSGVSTSGSEVWKKRLDQDFEQSRLLILDKHSDNSVVGAMDKGTSIKRLQYVGVRALNILIRLIGKILFEMRKCNYNKSLLEYLYDFDSRYSNM